MSSQSEAQLETKLIEQLCSLGYEEAKVHNEESLLANLKTQLELFNQVSLSEKEFAAVLSHLAKGNVFEKAKTLRDRFQLTRESGESIYLRFFDSKNWTDNRFQVAHQISMEGSYKNRYDVTLLVNGLPLVQIELKRRGLELKEAFHQVNRYQRHSFWSSYGLFQYVQIFVISNGANTKYFANNRKQDARQTYFWTDFQNRHITELHGFADAFLSPDHLGKMIAHYIVINETFKVLMILRPYQYHATEAVIKHVQSSGENGYIWHTTGSGKTLTSFKTSQIIMDLPEVYKVVFVVDRKDLDYQTQEEFNRFHEGSVDASANTKMLVDQFLGRFKHGKGEIKDPKLIITTVQKLHRAITVDRYKTDMSGLQDKRIIFIFDECHRSQFGQTHKNITDFFHESRLFGFTGTPIFAENLQKNEFGMRTTKDLFGECLHKYVITDAIRDRNVLPFQIEYLGRYKQANRTFIDIEVEDIDKREVLESPVRLEKIVDYIIRNHDRKTHNKEFSAIFAITSIDVLIKYYEIFKKKIKAGATDLRIATVFTFSANEEDQDANGLIPDETWEVSEAGFSYNTPHTRDKLEEFVSDYNQLYGTSFSIKDNQQFDAYTKNISKRLKDREKEGFLDKDRLDILLVVSMYLTGFDAKKINTLYVDRNLKHHGLIQAFSRTNRVIGEKKSHGNILCFRNLKAATDDAIALFSNKEARETIILPPYEEIVRAFSAAFAALLQIVPTPNSVNDLPDEEAMFAFVKAFRELMRIRNTLRSFTEFTWDDLPMTEQSFNNYASKYQDLREHVKSDREKEKVSILADVDFELELIHRDDVNVAYILKLLAKIKEAEEGESNKEKKRLLEQMGNDPVMRSKRELIQKFIEANLPVISETDNIPDEFEKYWHDQKILALNQICEEENLDRKQFSALLDAYIFTEQEPIREDVLNCLENRPSVLEARSIGNRIIEKMKKYVDVFMNGMVG
ncbi:type I restriction endonuclease subunit R [Leptonema illini]|uniref:Type I restriction enzyme endonuclease subunit n=1 Tax=Leptonema illini DSM 21528 TaxID=929563 RepID=H2CDH2_9LEPT|nr:type I restriction endonuclease subunit R [Leptonema illini]EHQ06505.1 type I site-specific deoxyribonuclease, HsdR family [Leptonema illini DSM 21528]